MLFQAAHMTSMARAPSSPVKRLLVVDQAIEEMLEHLLVVAGMARRADGHPAFTHILVDDVFHPEKLRPAVILEDLRQRYQR